MWKLSAFAAAAVFLSCTLAADDHAAAEHQKDNAAMKCADGKKANCCHHKKAKCEGCGKIVKITPVAKSADENDPGIIAIIEEYSISECIPDNAQQSAAQNPPAAK